MNMLIGIIVRVISEVSDAQKEKAVMSYVRADARLGRWTVRVGNSRQGVNRRRAET